MTDLLLAVDGGNSKTDVMIVDVDGQVLASVRGPSSAPYHFGMDGAMERLGGLVAETRSAAGLSADRPVALGVFAVAGADLPFEEVELARRIALEGWVEREIVRNDAFALLRAGSDRGWGVAVVCGAGINGVGVGPDGRVARFPGLGTISGDWGGGYDIGMAALGSSVRAVDGRGPATLLSQVVPEFFGLPDPMAVMTAIQRDELDQRRVIELPRVLFAAALGGDAVSTEIVLRLAGELVGTAAAAIRRLDLEPTDLDVVLGGSLLVAGMPLLDNAVREGVLRVAPQARVHPVTHPPVVGAALLALEAVGADPASHDCVRGWAP